ncbi:alpha/beta hydrolase [Enterococcus saccharolyticus]|uniref:alpha/beta hydrolase n=1 Tax=Enterococcus TaxID=1350 RepID=UPI001E2C0245|nr:alpha/beta hydrolase-fold protein [Enterococcus saccharolyticus]MCD5003534.1 alpha/beta hydrolase [Enterococcus saccharolyticus]
MLQIKTEKIHDYQITIVLPTIYDESKKYPTIYMHDGGNAAKQALNYIDHLIITEKIEPLIIVGIDPIDRNNDYTPWTMTPLFPNQPIPEGKAKEYLYTLVHKIKPFIDTAYATNPDPKFTAIAGCSFGGLVSIFASYYYPEVFYKYIVLSASFWYEDVLRYMQGETVNKLENNYQKPTINREKHQMYLYVGELEGIYRDSVQKYMVTYTKKAYHELQKEGFSSSQLLLETHPEGTHDVYFFSPHFIRALHWIYGKNEHSKETN